MIYFVTALMIEAKPIIKYYGLTKNTDFNRFPVYSGDDKTLIVSGTGMFKSAVATAFLIGSFLNNMQGSVIFNFGTCGSRPGKYQLGALIYASKITNGLTGRSFYPDLLIAHNLIEDTLFTSSSPVFSENLLKTGFNIVDMEAAGFAEAAFDFFPPHNIYCMKVVSDFLDSPQLDKNLVNQSIEKNLVSIDNTVSIAKKFANIDHDILTSVDREIIDLISYNLKLSATMKHQLLKLVKYYKIKYNKNPDVLSEFLGVSTNSKTERKIIFDRIRKILS